MSENIDASITEIKALESAPEPFYACEVETALSPVNPIQNPVKKTFLTPRRLVQIGVFGPMVGTIAAIAYAVYNGGVLSTSWWLLAIFYALSAFGIEAGYHRYFAHRSFQCSPGFQVVLGILGGIAGENTISEWVGTHWGHHKLADQPDDPHTPYHRGWKGPFRAHMGWLFEPGAMRKHKPSRRVLEDPIIATLDRYYLLTFMMGLFIPGLIGLAFGGFRGFVEGVLWGGLARVFFCHHATWCLNSLCHLIGSQPYKTTDNSRNVWFLSIFTMGGSWHNNHHAFPNRATNDHHWWQIDPAAWVLRLSAKMGWVWGLAPKR